MLNHKLVMLLAIWMTLIIHDASALSTIPFVGCSGVGVSGEVSAPTGKPVVIDIPQKIASKLAIYVSAQGSLAVLAPRGWSCASWMGNSSTGLNILAETKFPSGEAVTVDSEGVSGGSFWARYFPELYPQPYPPLATKYSSDALHSLAPNIIEFMTPAGHAGLGFDYGGFPKNDASKGNDSTLLPSLASYGVLAVNAGPDTGAFILSVRLPERDSYLRNTIITFFARCMNGHASVQCESDGAFVASGTAASDSN